MAKKLTYREIEQRIKDLEIEADKLKRAEKALKESEERFQQIAENAQEFMWEVDTHGLYTYASSAVEKVLGYKPQEIVGKKYFYDLFHPEDSERLKKAALDAFAKKEPFREFINRNVHKDGNLVWLSTSGVAVLNKEGQILGYRGADANITDRIRTEEALRESEERYRAVVDISPDVIFNISAGDGTITSLNPAFQKVTGWSDTEWLGKPFTSIIHIDDLTIAKENFEQVLSGEITSPFELRVRSKSGEGLLGEFIAAPKIKDGKVVAIFGFARDVTERKKAQEELETKTQNLQEANIALKVLLKKRDEDKTELEEKVLMNVKQLIEPLLEKLKKQVIDERLKNYLDMLGSNLSEIVSPFSQNLSLKYSNFTPTELRIANLIKEGKSSKEIAEMLNLSSRTVDTHRLRIRSKLGIRNKKSNLRSHLLSIQ